MKLLEVRNLINEAENLKDLEARLSARRKVFRSRTQLIKFIKKK